MNPPDPISQAESATGVAEDNGAPAVPSDAKSITSGPAAVETAAPVAESPAAHQEPAAADISADSAMFLGLTPGDARFAVLIGSVIVVLMLAHWMQLTLRGEPRVEIDRLESRAYEFQLDINRATWVEWMQLEGIGEALARRIVADRESNGPFTGVEDLSRVKGIGPKTLDAIRPHLRCPDCPTTETPP
jgi:competence protein ComEA